jgi:hypothetical protein
MFDYSMIGAPIPDGFEGWWPKKKEKPRVGNGGYSLRHVDTMKLVLETNSFLAEHPDGHFFEDVWWHYKIQNLPSEEKAAEFSVEFIQAKEGFIPTAAHKLAKSPLMKKMGKPLRLLQQYGRCI